MIGKKESMLRKKMVVDEPLLDGSAIFLEGLSQKHICERYVQWLNDKEVCRENRHGDVYNTLDMTKAYVELVDRSDKVAAFAIIEKTKNRHIGNISVSDISWKRNSGEIAIVIGDKRFWGRNIGTEAYKLVIEYAFNMLDLHRLYSGMTTSNIGMIKVSEKSGMACEGIFRDAFLKNGEYRDIVQYAIINPNHK